MRFSRILACGMALIGAYLLVLRAAWLGHLDETWLPYVAHAAGALIAGAVIVQLGGVPRFEPALGALAGIAIVAVINIVSPRTFSWVGLRPDVPWLIAVALAIGVAVLAEVGARLARGIGVPGGLGSVMILATTVTTCAVFLGGRVAFTLLARDDNVAVLVASMCVLAALAAFLVQWLVPRSRVVGCASGAAIVMLWELIEAMSRGHVAAMSADVLYLLFPLVAALAGSYVAALVKPAAVPDRALDAFD